MLCRIAPTTNTAKLSQQQPSQLCPHHDAAPTTTTLSVPPPQSRLSPHPSPRFCPHCHLSHVYPNATIIVIPTLCCPHYHYSWDRAHASTPTITSIAPSPHCYPNYHHLECGHNVTQTSTTIATIMSPRPYRLNYHRKCTSTKCCLNSRHASVEPTL